jgi:hypothetical protein
MVMSSDWALRPDAIERLVRRLEGDPGICLATGDWAQRFLSNGEDVAREPLVEGYEFAQSEEPVIDGRRFIESAFRKLRGVGIVYHSLILSDALRYANVEKVYLSRP